MKKLLSVLLVVCLMMGICVTASAATETYDLSSATKTSTLTISNGRANCISKFSSTDSNIRYVRFDQTLEKFSFLWFWDSIGTWNLTTTKTSFTLGNAKSGLTSGTYRLKTVFTITFFNGQQETYTTYSAEKKIA